MLPEPSAENPAEALEAEPGPRVVLRLDTPHARRRFFALAAAALDPDDALVRIADRVGEHEARFTTPVDPTARVLAHEPPRIMPGGETVLVTYLRVRRASLKAVEHRVRRRAPVETEDVVLHPIDGPAAPL